MATRRSHRASSGQQAHTHRMTTTEEPKKRNARYIFGTDIALVVGYVAVTDGPLAYGTVVTLEQQQQASRRWGRWSLVSCSLPLAHCLLLLCLMEEMESITSTISWR